MQSFFVAGDPHGGQAGSPGKSASPRRFHAPVEGGLSHFDLRREPRYSLDQDLTHPPHLVGQYFQTGRVGLSLSGLRQSPGLAGHWTVRRMSNKNRLYASNTEHVLAIEGLFITHHATTCERIRQENGIIKQIICFPLFSLPVFSRSF